MPFNYHQLPLDIASVRSENAKPLAKLNEGLERNSLELLHVGEVLHSFMLGLEEVTIQIFDGKTEESEMVSDFFRIFMIL